MLAITSTAEFISAFFVVFTILNSIKINAMFPKDITQFKQQKHHLNHYVYPQLNKSHTKLITISFITDKKVVI